MSIAVAYWVVLLIYLVLGLWSSWPNWKASGPNLLLFILLLILGWKVFGAPIRD